MNSKHYHDLLLNEYENKELSKEDFNDTLMEFARVYHQEKLEYIRYIEEEKDTNEIEVVYDVIDGAKAEQVYFDEAPKIKKLNNEFVRIYNNTSEPFKIEIQPSQTVEIRYLKDDSKQKQKN